MSFETFIVQLKDPENIKSFSRIVIERGGKVELSASGGSLVISIDNIFIDELRAIPTVKLMGGVNIQKRNVPIILKKQ